MSTPAVSAPAKPGAGMFRSAAVERMSSPERLDMTAAIVRPTAWLLLLSVGILAATALAASILIDVPIKVEAAGVLLNAAGVKEAAATGSGQIKTLHVHVGDRIKFGDVIVGLEQPDLRQQVETAMAELNEATAQLRQITEFQAKTSGVQDELREQQRQSLSSSVAFVEQRIGWMSERLHQAEDQAAKGAVGKDKLYAARVELGQAREELSKDQSALRQLDLDQDQQRNDRERERLALQLKVTTSERQLDQLKNKLERENAVTSPYSGSVAEIKVNEGEIVERGTPLVTIIPEDTGLEDGVKAPLVAVIFVSAAEGKKIKPGMLAEVLPATVKREETGFVVAKVTYVSEVPVTQEGMVRELKNKQLAQTLASDGAPFEVRAELTPDAKTPSGLQWSTSQGPGGPLSDGTPCRAEVVTRTEPVLQLLIPATRPLFDRMHPQP